MMNQVSKAKHFKQMEPSDKDLVMFTITDLWLEKKEEQVHMVISLKRKIQTEMLTTYLPTLLLLIITYATTFFKAIYFEASLTVNLTIMLVMTTIFTSKIEELPPTSDTKMIDIWLIFCPLVPFSCHLGPGVVSFNLISEVLTDPLHSGLATKVRVGLPKIAWVDEREGEESEEVYASREEEEQQGLVHGLHHLESCPGLL